MIATSELTDVLALAPLLPGLESPPPPFPVVAPVVAVLPGLCPGVRLVAGGLLVAVALGGVVLPGVGCTVPLLLIIMVCGAAIGPPEFEPLAQR